MRCVRAIRTERCGRGCRLSCREEYLRRRLHERQLGRRQHLLLLLGLRCMGRRGLLGDDGLPEGELSLSVTVPWIILRKLKCLLEIVHIHCRV